MGDERFNPGRLWTRVHGERIRAMKIRMSSSRIVRDIE
jgi:hypothetical protein